jgi:hypothetical protein
MTKGMTVIVFDWRIPDFPIDIDTVPRGLPIVLYSLLNGED